MQLKAFRCLFLVGVMGLMLSSVGKADMIGPNCGTCQGSTYLLTYDPTMTTTSGGVSTYDVFFTIDPTTYNGGGAYINAVAIKIASQEASTGNSVVNAPGGAGSWLLDLGGLNAGGCSGSGNGFICAEDSHTAPVPVAGKYTWEFHYATSQSLLAGPMGSSIKAEYVNASGGKVGALVSEDITLQTKTVPDGGMTLMLLGGVLVGLETLRRKFRA
jgi:hypothetical protein